MCLCIQFSASSPLRTQPWRWRDITGFAPRHSRVPKPEYMKQNGAQRWRAGRRWKSRQWGIGWESTRSIVAQSGRWRGTVKVGNWKTTINLLGKWFVWRFWVWRIPRWTAKLYVGGSKVYEGHRYSGYFQSIQKLRKATHLDRVNPAKPKQWKVILGGQVIFETEGGLPNIILYK